MINSIIVAGFSAVLSVYFSTMTAYAIHAYDFGLKKFIYPFILMIMMIPTQVTALGFVQLVGKMHLEDSFIPLIVPTIAAPITFFYMKRCRCLSSRRRVLTAPVNSIPLIRSYFP